MSAHPGDNPAGGAPLPFSYGSDHPTGLPIHVLHPQQPGAGQPWVDQRPVQLPPAHYHVDPSSAPAGYYAEPARAAQLDASGNVTFRAQVRDPAAPADPHGGAPTPPLPPVAMPYVAPRRDPQRTALAAIITFLISIVGLWAILAYMHSMAVTLSSVNASNVKVIAQIQSANVGLRHLDEKTRSVRSMDRDAADLQELMVGLDQNMGVMLTDLGTISTGMQTMDSSLTTLDREVETVGASNTSIGEKLGGINRGLKGQAGKVRGMRVDVQATSKSLEQIPPQLKATNARLAFINKVICRMGTVGLANRIHLAVTWIGIPNGSADIAATLIPPGGWTC